MVRGLVVDTAHFRGNHPQAVSVQAACVPGTPSPEDLLGPRGDVDPDLVPRTEIGGHAANAFAVTGERRFTHLRLNQHPDGGVARLRVYGEAVPDPAWLAALGTFDLVALENGGSVEDASDRFYSPAAHTILPRPLRARWTTAGRPAAAGTGATTGSATGWPGRRMVRAVEIDTAYLKGNAAGWAALYGRDGADGTWRELLARTRLQPDTVHRFLLDAEPASRPLTQVRIDIFPDGGIARLRVHGTLTDEGARALTARHEALSG